jgi:predicted nucleic acid-binding protein
VPVKQVYFDANIFIEMVEENANSAGPLLVDLFTANTEGRPASICTSELTLAEVLTGAFKQKNEHLIQTSENIFTPGGYLAIHLIERLLLREAAALRAKYTSLKLPDAIHLTTAIAHGCSYFLTSDTRIKGEFDHLDAFLGIKGKTPLQIMRPTEAPLINLIAESSNG